MYDPNCLREHDTSYTQYYGMNGFDHTDISCHLFFAAWESNSDCIFVNCPAGRFLYSPDGVLLAFELKVCNPYLASNAGQYLDGGSENA